MTLHELYVYCRANGYPAEADRCDHYLQLQGYVSPVGRPAP